MKNFPKLATALLALSFMFFVSQAVNAGGLTNVSLEQTSKFLFVADKEGGSVHVFRNGEYKNLQAKLYVGNNPTDILVSKNLLFVALSSAKKIKVFNADTLEPAGEIVTPKMPYQLSLGKDDSIWATVSKTNGGSYQPFVIHIVPDDIAGSQYLLPSWPGNAFFSGNDHAVVDQANNLAYFGNKGYSPDNIDKYDISDENTPVFVMQSAHGELGSNGKQTILDPTGSTMYHAAAGAEQYALQIINTSDLTKGKIIPLGAYPNSVAIHKDYLVAGKNAAYENGDVRVFTLSDKSEVRSYRFDQSETLLDRGLSGGENAYAVTNKGLYLLNHISSNSLAEESIAPVKIYDFYNMKDVINISNISVNASSSRVNAYWTTNQQGSCKFFYSKYQDFRDGVYKPGNVVQYGTEANNGLYHFALNDLELVGKYYYKIHCYLDNSTSEDSPVGTFGSTEEVSKPDLVVYDISLSPENFQSGELYSGIVKVEVKNIGQAAAEHTDGIKVSIALRNPDGSAINLNGVASFKHIGRLEAGARAVAEFPVANITFLQETFKAKAWVDNAEATGAIDESNENNNFLEKAFSVAADSPIVISGLTAPAAYLKSDSAKVTWTTNIKTDNIVMFMQDGLSSWSWSGNDSLSLEHAVELKNLKASTTYRYYVKSKDVSGNILKSEEKWLTTLPGNASTTNPVKKNIGIFGMHANRKTNSTYEIYWNTDTDAACKLVYGSSNMLGDDIIDAGEADLSIQAEVIERNKNKFIHKSVIEKLEPGKAYYYKAVCRSGTDSFKETKAYRIINKPDGEMTDKAKKLYDGEMEEILEELNKLRNKVKEQEMEIKYLKSLAADLKKIAEKVRTALSQFIAYGVDENSEKLGEGERAAVINSYKAAYGDLPDTDAEIEDVIKIANGRWPARTSLNAEKKAENQFKKIYKRNPDKKNASDNAAITVMAYGLRQKAQNRNLKSEAAAMKTFKNIYGHNPQTTEEWNILQAITYSGAKR